MSEIAWSRSSFCAAANCVEVAQVENSVWIRNSNHDDATPQKFTLHEWRAFIEGAKHGEFDA